MLPNIQGCKVQQLVFEKPTIINHKFDYWERCVPLNSAYGHVYVCTVEEFCIRQGACFGLRSFAH